MPAKASTKKLRNPKYHNDGWSLTRKFRLVNLERTRKNAYDVARKFLTKHGRMPSPGDMCKALGYHASQGAIDRFRRHWFAFIANELPQMAEKGEISVELVLQIMRTTPSDHKDPSFIVVKLHWICDYVLNHTNQPLSAKSINRIITGKSQRHYGRARWTKIIEQYRISKLRECMGELERLNIADVANRTAKSSALIARVARLVPSKYKFPREVTPDRIFYSVCDHIVQSQSRVPTYADVRAVFPFVPTSNTHGAGFMGLLKSWRKDRGFGQVRGGEDALTPRSWSRLVPELMAPVRTAPGTCLDPRATKERYPKFDDEYAHAIGKCNDKVIRSSIALAVLAGCGNRHSLPTFAHMLKAVIDAAKLSGPADMHMEDSLKAMVRGELDVGNTGFEAELDEESDDDEGQSASPSGFSNNQLKTFFLVYRAISFAHQKYLSGLPKRHHSAFSPFILPQLVDEVFWRSSTIGKVSIEAQRKWRKARTDALFPHFGEIRTIAEFRTNQANRLRLVFDKLVNDARNGSISLPHSFVVEEPESSASPAGKHHFILWSRLAIGKVYRATERLINYKGGDSATKQHDFFLEYKGVEPNQKGTTGVELWFADIARFNICHPEQYRDNRSKAFQKSYGIPNLLYVRLGSTLCGGRRLSASLLDLIRERRRSDPDFRPIYFHPRGLYTICLIGRSATRILCITACRANELLQIDVSADCLIRIEADHLPTPAYAFQAIPKLRQDPEPFFIDERCLRFLKEQAEWLASLSPGGVLNSMQACRALAKHKRQNIRPYIFQLPGKKPVAIDRGWIQAAVRFMIHGRLYKTTTGIPFQPALHDLRHLTSTVLRSNDVPLPVIAKMLKQRDHTVTEYYSEPTQTQIISAMQGLHLVTIGIGRTSGTRTASELKQQLADANGVVGALTKVSGGTCGVGSPCAARFACLGCAGLIPDHRERQQILRNQARLKEDLRYFSENGNMAEVRKCEQALVDCERVLAEMDLQEEADQDAGSAPTTVNTRKS
jgi:hypothetical protein